MGQRRTSMRFIATAGVVLTLLWTWCHAAPRFLDIDCSNFTCPNAVNDPVCGTDGQTYPHECAVTMENNKRICQLIGNFNPVMKAHDGEC